MSMKSIGIVCYFAKQCHFINNINILIYDKIINSICKMLSWIHDICLNWTWTHDATFTSEEYKFTHFIHKSKRFNIIVNLHIKDLIIKLKLNVQVFKV